MISKIGFNLVYELQGAAYVFERLSNECDTEMAKVRSMKFFIAVPNGV